MNNTYQSFILQNKLPICQLDIREHVVVDRVGGIKKITGARELFVVSPDDKANSERAREQN